MKVFNVGSISDPESSPTDRQERISWWSKEQVANAKVMVVGAGAIGNETLKNLALLGFRYIFVADFDTVSRSNLSRTVLFRHADIGKKKAEVAASRVREMAVADDVAVDWFHGDIVWELGNGIYREMDIVLGCLDNIETRVSVNRQCWLAGVPWIDAGISELACRVNVYRPPVAPCYECGLSREELARARARYSCDQFKLAMARAGKLATVQVASALVSALQVQEAVKLLCGQPVAEGCKMYFQGKNNEFSMISLPTRKDCGTHDLTCPEPIPLVLGGNAALRDFLHDVSAPHKSGEGATLFLKGGGQHQFVVSATCRHCQGTVEFLRPHFQIRAEDVICHDCRLSVASLDRSRPASIAGRIIDCSEFSLSHTPSRILDMTLREVGFPFCAVVHVRNLRGEDDYYSLEGDRPFVFPSLYARASST